MSKIHCCYTMESWDITCTLCTQYTSQPPSIYGLHFTMHQPIGPVSGYRTTIGLSDCYRTIL